jgi:hypothetical protein
MAKEMLVNNICLICIMAEENLPNLFHIKNYHREDIMMKNLVTEMINLLIGTIAKLMGSKFMTIPNPINNIMIPLIAFQIILIIINSTIRKTIPMHIKLQFIIKINIIQVNT